VEANTAETGDPTADRGDTDGGIPNVTGSWWWDLLIAVAAALIVCWIALITALISVGRAATCCGKPCGSCRTRCA